MEGTTLLQGKFTQPATAVTKRLALRTDVDWMETTNYSNISGGAATSGYKFEWQRGMADGYGLEYQGNAGALSLVEITSGGFTLINTSEGYILSGAQAVTGVTDATQPVVSTALTTGLHNDDIVRLSGISDGTDYAIALSSIDFQISTLVVNTSFKMKYVMGNDLSITPTTYGNWRKVRYDDIYYPKKRYIINILAAAGGAATTITEANRMVVTCSVDHGLTVGQKVRLVLPSGYGTVEADNLSATIVAVAAANTMQLELDGKKTGFSAFVFPQTSDFVSPALVIPFGEDTATALSGAVDILADATYNGAIIGMELAAGDDSPAGNNNEVIYWKAGKSSVVNNE